MTISNNDIDVMSADEAAYMIKDYLVRYGRVNVIDAKEKFGSVRVYCSLGFHSVYSIFHPGRYYMRWPLWLYKIDVVIGRRFISALNFLVVPYHKWLYRRAYAKAVEKFPYIKYNILYCANYPELLRGL